MALVVVPDDGDGQDGEIHEGEEGGGSHAQHDDDRGEDHGGDRGGEADATPKVT